MRILLFLLLIAGMAAYITVAAHRVFSLRRLSGVPAWLAWLLSCVPAAMGLALLVHGFAGAIIALAHLTGLLVLGDTVLCFVRSEKEGKIRLRAVAFLLSFAICTGYIGFAAVNAFTITPTFYSLSTDKSLGRDRLRIAHISDCHLGTTFDGKGFEQHLRDIGSHEPDVLVITGDLADSRSSREDIADACAALGDFDAPLGIYYVVGNHEDRMSQYKADELYALLRQAGVIILEDEHLPVDESFYICGRRDAYNRSRLSADELLAPLDDSLFTVVLDHQPREYEALAGAGADLVLSGHTHAGQMLPLNWFIEFIGMGERTYGMEQTDGTTFIVSSGLSGLIPLRTGSPSEYVIIDITGNTSTD